jgi:hypothetical protein
MQTKTVLVILLMLGAMAQAGARDWPAMREEADKGLPPWIQYYNRLKGEPKLGPFDQHLSEPESLNVRLVGKWGRGPAARVTGRDTLVFLALGSEVAVFNCVNAHNPTIVNEIQCRYVVDRPILKDSILYCVLQGGVEVFDVANPASPTRIKYMPITAVDMCISDTMAYTIGADSFKAYRIVAPDSFQRLGACADSGYYIAADSGFAYLCDRWGLYVIDATDPMNPHQVSILSSGIETISAWADSGYCYYSEDYPSTNFVVASVSDPYNPSRLGNVPGISAYDVCKSSFFVYLPGFEVIDVSQPNSPAIVGSTPCGGMGVWTRSPYISSFVATSYGDGLAAINITDPVHPALDTTVAGADGSLDISVDGQRAYVAQHFAGMKVVDVSSPARPSQLGSYDTAGQVPRANAVSARDSFAYLCTQTSPLTDFRVIDVSNPTDPRLAATCGAHNGGEAVVVRDSLAFVAEEYWFLVYSIANPRNPRLVGSCGLPNASTDLCIADTIAYVASLPTQVVNIKDPVHPAVVGVINNGVAWGIRVQDTIALVGGDFKLDAVSVANPAEPRVISSFPLPGEACYGIALDGSLAYVGTSSEFRVFDISNPESLRSVGYRQAPAAVVRVFRQDSLVYAACYGAGVCIFETTSTSAIAEASPVVPMAQAIELTPNPASSFVDIKLEVRQNTSTRNTVRFFNAAGRVVLDIPYVRDRGQQPRSQRVDISTLPDGCYFVAVEPSGQGRVQKVTKTGKRR